MGFQKTGDAEKIEQVGDTPAEAYRGEEAQVVNQHLAKTGKKIDEFSDEELEAFHSDLDAVRPNTSDEANED